MGSPVSNGLDIMTKALSQNGKIIARGLIMKKLRIAIFLLAILSLFSASSCVTTPNPVTTGIPEGYVMLKKEVLTDLMEKCARCKSELLECLERERVNQ